MNTRLASVGLALLFASAARADFNPIAITPGSYNADVVVEAAAAKGIFANANVTIDGGTNNNGNTFFERGLEVALPWTGLPLAGTTFDSISDATRHYKMAPSYTAANCLYVGGANWPGTTTFTVHNASGTLTLSPAAAYNSLSILYAGGGNATNTVVVHHADATIETFNNINTFDWFNTAITPVWVAAGRISLDNAQFNTLNSATQTKLMSVELALANTTSPVTSVDITYINGNARLFVFGLSGSTGGDYNPITVTGFNKDVIIEKTAVAVVDSVMATTVTGDGGTNNTSNILYERGFNVAAPTTGMPPQGTLITNAPGDHVYRMPASYAANNCMFLNNQGGTFLTGNFTLTTPTACSGLSCLAISAATANVVNYTVHHSAPGVDESGSFTILDWFTGDTTPAVYTNRGRFSQENLAFNSVNVTSAVKLYTNDIVLADAVNPVTGIDFVWVSGGRSFTFALSAQTNANGTFFPVSFSGFNADAVVEAGAYTTAQLTPSPHPASIRSATTISMDGGTNNNGNTWHERGYYAQQPLSGLPAPNTIIDSLSLPDHHYRMPASYTANNAVFIDFAHTQANLTISVPATYSALSFLSCTANNNVTNRVIMQYADGSSETNVALSRDWFNNTPFAFSALGRMSTDNRCINNDPGRVNSTNNMNPRFYEAQFALGNVNSPVTNIILQFLGAINPTTGRAYIMAVSATAGALAPIISGINPININTIEGRSTNITITISGGTPPITYQWQAGPIGSGVWTNLSNGGTFSGVNTTNLVITNPNYAANQADYRCIASNGAGSTPSGTCTMTLLSGLPDVLNAGDPIQLYQPSGGGSPIPESVDHAIDHFTQKYLNFGVNGGAPFAGPVGFTATPSIGSTIVSVMRLTTANDNVDRDPADYVLEGSNDGGATWDPISSGALNLPAGRNAAGNVALNPLGQAIQEIRFGNSSGYTSYRWSVNNVKNNGAANSMQIGEVELLGVLTPTPPIITREPVPAITNYVGAHPTFIVAAVGFPTNLTYQWTRNGSPIANATRSAYTRLNVQLADTGSTFACTVANANGSTNSTSSTLYVVAAPTQPYPVAVLADNPTSFWPLGEPETGGGNPGVVANDLWAGRNGIYTNTLLGIPGYNAIEDPNTAAEFGTVAGADSFAGEINGIDFAASSNTPVNMSVEAWVNGGVQTAGGGLVTKGTGGGGEQFCLDTGGANFAFRFFIRDGSGTARVANGTVAPDGAWHHLVGVCNQAQSNVVLYIDGLSNASVSLPILGMSSSLQPVAIGSRRQNGGTNYNLQFVGQIDDVAIYDKALTPAQVLNHYLAGHYPPAFTVAPTNTTAAENAPVTFYSSAYGSGTVNYQWYDVTAGDPGTPIGGQTAANMSIAATTIGMNGNLYRVVACNPYGCTTSPPTSGAAAGLTVIGGPPQFLTDIPLTNLVYAGSTIVYAPKVVGTAPFTFQWKRNGGNLSNGGRISGATTSTLTIANAQGTDSAQYQLHVSNNQGIADSALSQLFVESRPDFNDSGLGWTLNGVPPATIVGDELSLTTGAGGIGNSSAWYNYPLYIGSFYATWIYRDQGGVGNTADGYTFTLQNDPRGLTALGGGGGGLGVTGIAPSAELTFNIYTPNTIGVAFHINGEVGAYTPVTPIVLDSGNPISFTVTYLNGIISLFMQDTVTLATYSASVPANLPAIVGGPTAYMGFTGAEGGVASTQTITNFVYLPLARLTQVKTGPNTLQLSWPPQVGGYTLQQADNLTGPWVDIAGPPTPPYNVTISGARKFYRLSLSNIEP